MTRNFGIALLLWGGLFILPATVLAEDGQQQDDLQAGPKKPDSPLPSAARGSPRQNQATGQATKKPAGAASPGRPRGKIAVKADLTPEANLDAPAQAQPPAQAATQGPGQTPVQTKEAPAKKDLPKVKTVPLAPTQEDLQRQRAAKERAADRQKDSADARAASGRLPTQIRGTAGPGSSQGAGTAQDRKAAAAAASDPAPFFHN
jgi:hypothetical protein